MRNCLLVVSLIAAVGCSGGNRSGTVKSESLAPITEADVKTAVADHVNRTQGYYFAKAKSVELLSPLFEPPEKFFQEHRSYDRNSVACYVLIELEPAPGQTSGRTFNTLVVVIRDNGQILRQDAGKLKVPVTIQDEPIRKATFGEDWAAQHPPPATPKRP